jgi:hypothetical protein
MRRARDVREQIEGLMIRVEIEMTSNPIDDVAIRKYYSYEALTTVLVLNNDWTGA